MFSVRLWYLNVQFNFSYLLLKTKFKMDEKFNTKGIQNNGIWNQIVKGYWENKPFLNLA